MSCSDERKNKFTFVWRIENFCLCELQGENYLESSVFTPFLHAGVRFRLQFYPRPSQKCSCCLVRERNDAGVDEITLSYYFEISSTNDDVLKSDEKTYTFNKGACECWSDLIDHQNILENRRKYLPADCLTIHLHVWGEAEVLNTYPIIARTEIVAEKCSLSWNIHNFSSCELKKTKFSFPSDNSYEITLDASDEDLKFTICEKNSVGSHILRSEIFVQDSAGVKKWSKLQEHQFGGMEAWEFPSFLMKSKLVAEKFSFLTHDVLRLYCKFALSTGEIRSQIMCHFEEYSGISDIKPLCSLQEDFQNIFTSKGIADVTFKVDDKTLSAHKLVLAAKSPVFAAMFEQDMLENKSGIVDILDMSYDTLEEMLIFMYGAKLENLNLEKATNLIVAADKYQVLSLKDECSMFLKLNLCDENFSHVLAVSDMIQDGILKMSTVEYFRSHKKTVLLTTEWKELAENNPRLAIEVFTLSALDDRRM